MQSAAEALALHINASSPVYFNLSHRDSWPSLASGIS
jgi:hypothetical protein